MLDQYPAHTSEVIQQYALNKNIKLIYIPVGYTYKFQPLDVAINGILKIKNKALWRRGKIQNINLKISHKDAITYLLIAINEITRDSIKNSFIKADIV